jgi:hypothetical protein
MEWMSRILVGEMAGSDEDFGSEVGQMWLILAQPQLHCTSFDARNSVFVDARLTLRLLPGVKQKKWVDCQKGKRIKVGVSSLRQDFSGHSRSFCNATGS